VFYGCSSSEKNAKAADPIVLNEIPPEVNETESIVHDDDVLVSVKMTGDAKEEEVRSFKKGDWVRYQNPLPSYQPIFLKWSKGEEELQKTLAYHAWDLNLDGKLDMFEGVDINGDTYIKLYDFDFNGSIDHVEKKHVSKVQELETLSVE
jgi:hypothetical protein